MYASPHFEQFKSRYGSELSPAYVDVAVIRWQQVTGKNATLDGDGRSFDEIKEGKVAA